MAYQHYDGAREEMDKHVAQIPGVKFEIGIIRRCSVYTCMVATLALQIRERQRPYSSRGVRLHAAERFISNH